MTALQITRTLRVPAVGVSAATLLASALALQEYFADGWAGGSLSYMGMLFAHAVSTVVWAALIPAVVLPLARRFPVSPTGLLLHGVTGVGLAVAQTLVVAVILSVIYYGWSPAAARDIFRDRMYTAYAWNVFTYLLIAAFAVVWHRRHESGGGNQLSMTAAPRVDSADADSKAAVPTGAASYIRRVLVRDANGFAVVPTHRIHWLAADDNDVIVHADGKQHRVRSTLSGLAARLDPSQFVRVHRSAIVNVECVREVQTWFGGDLVAILTDGTRVNVGRSFKDAFLAALGR